jgi:tRNA pseudouridine(55) synthase
MFGFLNINKPKGISSTKVTSFIKYTLKEKAGHIGTLDPLADGVLPIAVGKATKLIPLFEDSEKIYEFTIQFGSQTSTSDAAGSVLGTSEYTPSHEECKAVTTKFIGTVTQIPNAFSAIKINGVRAYKLARAGILTTTSKERNVNIYDLHLKNYNYLLKQATYRVKCSKGTYVRCLTEDICSNLNTLGFASSISRIVTSQMTIQDSICFLSLKNTPVHELIPLLEKKLEATKLLLYNIPAITLLEDDYSKVIKGQFVSLNQRETHCGLHANVLAYFQNKVIALGNINERNIFYPKKILI